MGGMIALRAVLRHPGFFTGMILNGPLIVPGPQVNPDKHGPGFRVIYCQVGPIDFRSTPFRTFVSKAVLQLLSWVIPHVPIGRPNMNIITRSCDKDVISISIAQSVNNEVMALIGTRRLKL